MRTPSFALWTLWSVLTLLPTGGRAQGTRADYERADALRERTRDKVVKTTVRPHWSSDGTQFWYRNDLAGGAKEYVVVDAVKGKRQLAFDHAKLAEALTKSTGKPHAADRLEIDRITVEDHGTVLFESDGKRWRFDPKEGTLEAARLPDSAPQATRGTSGRARSSSPRSATSPDGKWIAFIRDHNVYVREKSTGAEHALSLEGSAVKGYEPNVFWSPDSKKLVALRTAKGDERKVYLIESSPKDQLQPKLQSYDYLKPGDQVPISRPRLFDVANRKPIAVSDELAPNPYEIGDVRWSPDSKSFTYLYNQRGHQALRLIAVDASSGEARAIIDESSPTFIDYSQKFFLSFLDESKEILWMSERDGWNHLYLFDARTGRLKHQVTKGEWVVRGVDRVDEETQQIWFRAGGIRPGQDPYYIHYARVNFDGTGLVILTEGDGTHTVNFSPDRRYLVDTYSRVDHPPVTELRSVRDGSLVCALETADASALLSNGWQLPERFTAKGRDGKTEIYGVIYRPTSFDPKGKYPVIEAIYAGPQGAFVPKAFVPLHRSQATAELGFIVVQIDGMGTNWRSKAFHDVCWKNLGDAGFPDRIAWMKAAGEKYPYMDLSRVGLYGGSAGGQNALGGLLFHCDFYKVGVADCGCHDNRMDKIWWNEAWMGWPVGPHYAASSNVTNAHRLRGKLLLTVGELDRNVDPASTMQVVNALIKAGKDFELIVFPGGGHGAGSGRYGERRRRDFFVKHLLKVEPPDWNAEKSEGSVASAADAPPPGNASRIALKPSERSASTPEPERPRLDASPAEIRGVIERYTADLGALRRTLPGEPSESRRNRLKTFLEDQRDTLGRLDFGALSRTGKVDYVLLRNEIDHELRQLDVRAKNEEETSPLVPFGKTITALEEARRRMEDIDPAKSAATLDELAGAVKRAHEAATTPAKKFEGTSEEKAKRPSAALANRAAREVDGLRRTLREWYSFHDGYDPLFTWWAAEPYKAADNELHSYATYLRESLAGVRSEGGQDIVGDPIGDKALKHELAYAMVPYTAVELVAIANKELAWCDEQMKKASHDMGFGDDWKKALEKVKTLYVAPGKQPALIRDLALEAIRFVDEHDLVTVPPLARESWRMEMMSPQRQLVNPFFTGGEVISVSYPTSTMTHEQKLMSMRGNNIHFARATVHHEVIPGHHLQGFMSQRYRPYRRVFSTPFSIEGWALYWELLLWDKQFPKSPEDRIGMLFWRMHRCARIIFSLNFHLGKMTPRECIDFLVERVGHERDNATAEVRRSFAGNYEPLYQSAYLLGGLQIRALRRELVESGKMTERAFHDAILHENAIPIEMVRASLTDEPIARDFQTRWRFYDVEPKPQKADK